MKGSVVVMLTVAASAGCSGRGTTGECKTACDRIASCLGTKLSSDGSLASPDLGATAQACSFSAACSPAEQCRARCVQSASCEALRWPGSAAGTSLALCDAACAGGPPADASAADVKSESVVVKRDSAVPRESGPGPFAPCVDPATCCTPQELVCQGNPGGPVVCSCSHLWDCTKKVNTCEQPMPTPDGTDWQCVWSEFKYTCRKAGSRAAPPSAGADWGCKFIAQELTWECSQVPPPNPTNTALGLNGWTCSVDDSTKKIVCETKTRPTQPTGSGIWQCAPDGKVCVKQDENGGIPSGGNTWTCHRAVRAGVSTWICYGSVPSSAGAPAGAGWSCVKVEATGSGLDTYRCEKPEGPSDYPPGGGWYACAKGTSFGGTTCAKVEQSPLPPTPGQKCSAGEKAWCDGRGYGGWGQVSCDPGTNTWKTTVVNGKTALDCNETVGGVAPGTVCACYHFFFNSDCCERPDCIVPPGSSGQQCPPSAGGLCGYCNPLQPACKELGATCIVSNSNETFCGRACSTQQCPTGYTCVTVKLSVGTTKQCIPTDFSCYYD